MNLFCSCSLIKFYLFSVFLLLFIVDPTIFFHLSKNSEDCPHCKSKGLENKLRYFYLSLEEKIYKCENASCLYPFERFMFKSLIDSSVYYYEEVVDSGRELFFRVPLDGQNDFQLSNPLSTQLFCDNQRNPLIEDYNCDFSDLFNDIDTDLESGQAKLPTPTENPDALEFLDEINNINTSNGPNANESEIDSIIDDILNESPVKCSPNKPTQSIAQNVNSGTSKEQPKLLKCIQHLDKAKKAQSRKTSEKSKHPFATAMLKARKNQTKLQGDPASTDEESECPQTSQQKPKQISRPSSTAGFLKSANNLRPTELARKLSSFKSLQTNSQFLQQYMKRKEDKLFADEPEPENVNQDEIGSEKTVAICNKFTKPNQNILPDPHVMPVINSMEQPTSTATKKANSSRKSVKKEPSIAISTPKASEVKKKERKPRSKKQNNVVNDAIDIDIKKEQPNIDLNGADVTATKKRVPAKRKPAKANQSTESCSTNTEMMDQNQMTVIKTEPKKNSRKRKETPAKSVEKDKSENVVPAKRQRKPKCDSEDKTGENKGDEIKPKRTRTTKPKVKVEQPSLPLLLNNAATGK